MIGNDLTPAKYNVLPIDDRSIEGMNGGLGKGGLGTIYVNDKKVAEGRIERTQPMIFSADETADVGVDDAMPVTEDYKMGHNEFTGKIHKVTISVGEMGAATKAAAAQAGAETAGKLETAK